MLLDDNRVSKFQRQIYDWLKELYPSFKIELEKLIPSTNQRIDIYVHQLQLAIECDGSFHDKPTFFFVKTIEQWNDIISRDKLKTNTLSKYDVDLIRIPYNHKLKSSTDLGILIDEFYSSKESFNFIDESIFIDTRKQKENEFLKQVNEYSKEKYQQFKESNDYKENKTQKNQKLKELRQQEYQKNKDILKQRRQEQYKKFKESQKNEMS